MPHKQELSAEEKGSKVIEDCIKKTDEIAAFMTCKNRVCSQEFKRQAVEDYFSGILFQ